jgi:K(+)-stimulated pyrophosphate-energized sodium pump
MIIWSIAILSFLGLVFALFYTRAVLRAPVGYTKGENSSLQRIHSAIAEGASAFLRQEYKFMFLFMLVFGVFIFFSVDDAHTEDIHEGIYTLFSFELGCLISILAGYIGMKIATAGNVRTAVAAQNSLEKAFKISLNSGCVMGFALVSLAVLGLLVVYLVTKFFLPDADAHILFEVISGFGLGGSSIALFGRVGGGIFTKAADVGADLVGKVEKNIPEDDPRNPAVIADNVGDNVGDVAGMGADLFGSCAESTCAALVIGAVVFASSLSAALYPVLLNGVSIPISLLTLLFIRAKTEKDVAIALKKMLIISTVLMAIVTYFLTLWALPEQFQLGGLSITASNVYFSYLSGLVAGLIIGILTEYYTSHSYKPVQELAQSCNTGAATNVIFGIALGFRSCWPTILALAVAIFIPFQLAGMYGVAIAALGMLGTLVIGLTIDAYGPVADNAGGIAEMSGMKKEVRERTDVLDAAGNTTAAIGKGYAVSSAVLTSLALFAAFLARAEIISGESFTSINVLDPLVLSGLFAGTILPFLFSALAMKAVGKAAYKMIDEVRRQFNENPGIMKGEVDPDYRSCVAISTNAALKQMVAPGLLIILTPLLVGLFLGIQALAGLLLGSLLVSTGLAIFQSNAGGAWDNAKKYIEQGFLGGKGTEAHKASVVGDTVGDPFKDTSGPSLNILMKLSAILSLVFVPFFVEYGGLLLKLF